MAADSVAFVSDLGPQPQACVDRLLRAGIPCVRGNHDSLDEATARIRL